MAFNLPIYKIVGMRPIKMEETSDGGSLLSTWDWKKKDFVQGGDRDFDAFMEYESSGDGEDVTDPGTPLLGGADVRTVSEAEFEAHVAKLKKS